MLDPKPPRDWLSTLAGLGAVLGLAAALGTLFAGPAVRLMAQARQEVWVTIVRPTPTPPAPLAK